MRLKTKVAHFFLLSGPVESYDTQKTTILENVQFIYDLNPADTDGPCSVTVHIQGLCMIYLNK